MPDMASWPLEQLMQLSYFSYLSSTGGVMQDTINWVTVIAAMVSVVGAISSAAILIYKARAEVSGLKASEISSYAGASESIADGAKVSNELLLQRIEELTKKDADTSEKLETLQHDFAKIRLELNEWQDWARRLSHQVKSLGHEPVAFKPVFVDPPILKRE